LPFLTTCPIKCFRKTDYIGLMGPPSAPNSLLKMGNPISNTFHSSKKALAPIQNNFSLLLTLNENLTHFLLPFAISIKHKILLPRFPTYLHLFSVNLFFWALQHHYTVSLLYTAVVLEGMSSIDVSYSAGPDKEPSCILKKKNLFFLLDIFLTYYYLCLYAYTEKKRNNSHLILSPQFSHITFFSFSHINRNSYQHDTDAYQHL